jgi:hypothetical protein
MEFRNEFTYPISSLLARLVIHNNTESAAFAALSTTGTPVDAKYEPSCGDGGRVCCGEIFVDVPKSNLPAT